MTVNIRLRIYQKYHMGPIYRLVLNVRLLRPILRSSRYYIQHSAEFDCPQSKLDADDQ